MVLRVSQVPIKNILNIYSKFPHYNLAFTDLRASWIRSWSRSSGEELWRHGDHPADQLLHPKETSACRGQTKPHWTLLLHSEYNLTLTSGGSGVSQTTWCWSEGASSHLGILIKIKIVLNNIWKWRNLERNRVSSSRYSPPPPPGSAKTQIFANCLIEVMTSENGIR